MSFELIEALHIPPDAAVIDIGGGASQLVDHLVERGYSDLTVLDISASALDEVERRLGASSVLRLHEDLLDWRPERLYDLWHDRALFHFLVASEDRDRYLLTLRSAIRDNGFVVLATFATDAPEFCSGLPVIRYSAADLVQMIGAGFELLETRREEHITPRGLTQPFTWVAGHMRPA
jgi:cyclopropane fatty-acyl-phospholipid synthase-like methyltransferase